MIGRFLTVNAILERAGCSHPACKGDLARGDEVLVTTENSVSSIRVLEEATYRVRGGWFDRQRLSSVATSISGCSWGGSVIKRDIVAARGLHLEFGNRVLTSRIREILVIRGQREGQGLRPIHSSDLFVGCYGPRWESISAA